MLRDGGTLLELRPLVVAEHEREGRERQQGRQISRFSFYFPFLRERTGTVSLCFCWLFPEFPEFPDLII
ncbi:hypothetical protein Mnod_0882 [Methylobacterium nodulans ORS 2060]|uniref:Uncharacterized protein n=1 Tax=Methylobacterium nodulans (strain LMG 21967 / CNCM I-2342 / ORS 2060) TaxID=460265 RepID=B8IGK5_METNO|nr:hypothetical protein Mnod_0882 [Methylobacterium nodulans ORS 2060]